MRKNLNDHLILAVHCHRGRASAGQVENGGFTLLEIMIAIFIFAVVITTIFTSYSSVSSGNKIIDQDTASYEMATNCLNRMVMDLKSIHLTLAPGYTPSALGEPPEMYRIVGEINNIQGTEFPKLRFTSLSHISFGEKNESGIAEIVYYIQASDDGNFVLKRADKLYPYGKFEEKPGDPILCRDVKSLTIKYYDSDGNDYDQWDSDSEDAGYSTPRAIDIKLELAEGSNSLAFETMVNLPIYRVKKK
ncbi:MAG: type II secretion system protein GspJ [Desulfobacterales bacterium]